MAKTKMSEIDDLEEEFGGFWVDDKTNFDKMRLGNMAKRKQSARARLRGLQFGHDRRTKMRDAK